MSANTKKPEQGSSADSGPDKHLLISSGGSRAILAGAGVILISDFAGINTWKSVGGISGGSLPSVMVAAGMDAKTTVMTALDIDFASLLNRRGSMLKIFFAYLMQSRYEKTRPRFGVLSSEQVGDFVEDIVAKYSGEKKPTKNSGVIPVWPRRYPYWTMANVGDDHLVFNSSGIHEIKKNGDYRLLNTEPAPLGAAVRGSCAVPGIIDAVPVVIGGKEYWLLDGALSAEGRTPTSVPEKFFGAKPEQIIICDVGDGGNNPHGERKAKRAETLWRIICGKLCVPEYDPEPLDPEKGYVIVEPTITNFGSLQFTLTRDQKWEAVMSGFMGGVAPFAKAGLLKSERLALAQQIAAEFNALVAECRKKKAKVGVLSAKTEELLKRHGVW